MSNKNKPVKASKYQPRANSSTTTYVLAGVAVAVIAAIVVVGIVINSNKKKETADVAILEQASSFSVGKADAPHTIDIFEDFQCPACKMLEQRSGAQLTQAVNDGKLRIRYHMLNFLDRMSASGDYSTRAAGAAKCVADEKNPQTFVKFHTRLFEIQPEEGGSSDLSNAQLADVAKEAGANQQTQDCVRNGGGIAASKENAKKSKEQLETALGSSAATPSVLSEGKLLNHSPSGWIEKLLASPADAQPSGTTKY